MLKAKMITFTNGETWKKIKGDWVLTACNDSDDLGSTYSLESFEGYYHSMKNEVTEVK